MFVPCSQGKRKGHSVDDRLESFVPIDRDCVAVAIVVVALVGVHVHQVTR